jgi:hypothetical protein
VQITSAVAGTTVVSATSDIPTSVGPLTRTTNTALNTAQGGSGNASKLWIAPANQGCTPGFWKQDQHFHDYPTGFSPNETLTAAGFVLPTGLPNDTLLVALNYSGGPTIQAADDILLRQAVAALLDAGALGIKYQYTAAQVLSMTNAALATGNRDTVLGVAEQFNTSNNASGGCPLS